jgi:hypothetical protein
VRSTIRDNDRFLKSLEDTAADQELSADDEDSLAEEEFEEL